MKRAIEIDIDKDETENPRVKAAIYLSCIAGVCTLLILILVSKIFDIGIYLPICGLAFILVLISKRLMNTI